jgi:ABC-type Zn uptake system ZnuABC Zn-binding protein ZnuA
MRRLLLFLMITGYALTACQAQLVGQPTDGKLHVLATTGFLADLTQQVAGERAVVESLIPAGADPHAFEPAPQDVARIAGSSVLVVNGAGFEEWLTKTLENAGGSRALIVASQGMTPRQAENPAEHAQGDPHFWLDPLLAKTYVDNIRDGLSQADPAGAAVYAANAAAYQGKLDELDAWIRSQVETIPPARRLLVTNHESFGYFAERYGFTIVGAVVPSVSSSASPSAQDLARLIDQIKATGAPAIFLESGTNPQLADQVARDTGVRVVTGLLTHSFGPEAQNYIAMMKLDTQLIVDALK